MTSKSRNIGIGIGSAVVAYSVAWFGYASYVEGKIKEKVFGAYPPAIGATTYDSMSLGGYPFNIVITAHNTKSHINFGEIIKDSINNAPRPNVPGMQPVPDIYNIAFESDIAFSGDVVIKTDLLTTDYKISNIGDTSIKTTIEGKPYNLITKSQNSNSELKFKKSPLFMKAPANGEDFLQNILATVENVSISVDNLDIINADTNVKLMHADHESFSTDIKDTSPTLKEVDFKLSVKNNEYTPDMITFLGSMRSVPLLNSIIGNTDNITKYGKNNIELELKSKGPLNEQDILTNKMAHFEVVNFEYSNDLYSNKLNGLFDFKNENVAVVLHGESKFTQQWYDMMMDGLIKSKQAFDAMSEAEKQAMFAGKVVPNSNWMNNADAKNSIDFVTKIYTYADKMMPKMHQFGAIKYDVDVNMDKDQHFTIKQFDLVSDLYGIKVNGEVKNSKPTPEAKVAINLLNYPGSITDAVAYYTAIVPAVTEMNGHPMPFEIKDGFKDALIKLVQAIADNPNDSAKDATITVIFDSQHPQPMIGSMNMMNAMMTASTSLMPYIKIVQPAQAVAAPVTSMAPKAQVK